MTLRPPAWPPPLQTLWLAWRRHHDPNMLTTSCVLIGWLLLTQFAAAPAHTLLVTLLPTALPAIQALTATLTVELVSCGALLTVVATQQWWQHASLTTTRTQLTAALRGFGWLLPGLLAARLGMVIVLLAGVVEHRTHQQHPLAVLAALVTVAVVEMALTAIAEELLFRGLVFNTLLAAWGTTRRGIYQAAITSSVLFGAVHLLNGGRIGQLLISASFITAIGLILAGLRLRTRSIWAGVALHMANNVTGVLALIGSISAWWLPTPATTPTWILLGLPPLVTLFGVGLIESHCQSPETQPHHHQHEPAEVSTT